MEYSRNKHINRYKLIILCPIILAALFQSCKEETACTEEFRTIGITITGDSLTDFYTIRISNSDTIRISLDGYPNNQTYPILNDSYQSVIANSQESFNFIGEFNDTFVVNEVFVISADNCHIDKVSGKSEVSL